MNPTILKAADIMRNNLGRRFCLSDIASSVDLSRSHFCHLFKMETGLTPGEYFVHLKMEKAALDLTHTLISIKVIMAEVGYKDKSHFARDFKKVHGLTPSDYRAKHYGSARHIGGPTNATSDQPGS